MNIPLREFIEILLSPYSDFTWLSRRQTELIIKGIEQEIKDECITLVDIPIVPGNTIIHYKDWTLESTPEVYFPGTNIKLPPCNEGERRLWFRKAWEEQLQFQEVAKKREKELRIKSMLKDFLNTPET